MVTMRVQWSVSVVVLLVIVRSLHADGGVTKRDQPASAMSLCDIAGCNCTKFTESWIAINCTLGSYQRVEFLPGFVPNNTIELFISGGYEIILSADTFRHIRGFALLRVDGTRNFSVRKQAFNNLDSTFLNVEVIGCDRLILENHAFKNMETPIRAEVTNCNKVLIRNSAFSRLHQAKFDSVQLLELAVGAFTFENQGDFGKHGPATNLTFVNVTMPIVPNGAFSSALAEINIINSDIDDIQSDAFKAPVINTIFINASNVRKMRTGALSHRTLINNFILSKTKVLILESHAIMAAITNLTVQFSIITEIHSGAINSSVTANIVISDNQIRTLSPYGLTFNNWNTMSMDNNIILNLRERFLEAPYNPEILLFSFSENELYNVDSNAFHAIPELQYNIGNFKFSGNWFNETCRCNFSIWLEKLMNNTNAEFVWASSYCTVDVILSGCFHLNMGVINMKNFSELVCGPENTIKCEPYNGETKVLNTTSTMLTNLEDSKLTLLSVLLIAGVLVMLMVIVITIIAWIRNRRLCLSYNNDRTSNEDEGVMVPEESSDKYEVPELTQELLQQLRDQLENPDTHDLARELIERLYEQLVVEESTNNNRQDEEAHLYEELGNMQSGASDGIANYLKVMQDKLNFPMIDQDEYKPALVSVSNEYSEPSDAAVHLYSELKNKVEDEKGSLKSQVSNGSRMAFRPLPEKPKDEAGPSTKY